jgi:putative transposase
MARQPRLVLPGEPHLVGQRGLNGETIARDAADAQAWLSILRDVVVTRRIALHAFSLRPQEFRLLVSPPDDEAVARLLQDVGRRYVAQFNLRHGRSGTLWAGRFRCAAIERGRAELLAMAWVETEDGAVPLLSSAAHHTGLILDPGIGDPPAYWALGNTPFDRQAVWRERLGQGISASQAAQLERALRTGIPMADAATLRRLQPLSPLRLIPRPRGRPRSRPPP